MSPFPDLFHKLALVAALAMSVAAANTAQVGSETGASATARESGRNAQPTTTSALASAAYGAKAVVIRR